MDQWCGKIIFAFTFLQHIQSQSIFDIYGSGYSGAVLMADEIFMRYVKSSVCKYIFTFCVASGKISKHIYE